MSPAEMDTSSQITTLMLTAAAHTPQALFSAFFLREAATSWDREGAGAGRVVGDRPLSAPTRQ